MNGISHSDILIGLGVLLLGVMGFYLSSSTRYFTIREHNEHKASIIREFDKIHEQIVRLETTRPTTGELEAKITKGK
jgi:hypothetical protein